MLINFENFGVSNIKPLSIGKAYILYSSDGCEEHCLLIEANRRKIVLLELADNFARFRNNEIEAWYGYKDDYQAFGKIEELKKIKLSIKTVSIEELKDGKYKLYSVIKGE